MNRRDFVSGIAALGFVPVSTENLCKGAITDSATGNIGGSFSEPIVGEIRTFFETAYDVPHAPMYGNPGIYPMRAVAKFYVFDGENGWRPLGDSGECIQNIVDVWNKALRAAHDADGQG